MTTLNELRHAVFAATDIGSYDSQRRISWSNPPCSYVCQKKKQNVFYRRKSSDRSYPARATSTLTA